MSEPALWITLRKRPHRGAWFREHTVDRFPHMDWQRVWGMDPGVWGVALEEGPKNPRTGFTTLGQMGCWLSHVMVWDRIVAAGWQWTLVMEDDAKLLGDPFRRVEGGREPRLIYLGGRDGGAWNRGTWAYMVNRAGAGVLLDRMRAVNVDHMIWDMEGIEKQVMEPEMAEHVRVHPSDTEVAHG